MKRILFVDDEPHVLAGLSSRLRRNRHRWEMAFVSDGEVALAELEKAPYDVIVTDIRMPGIDGASLLERVKRRYPRVVRIALSGYSEFESSLRALPVVHQFLSKPCDGLLLENVLERACNLQSLLGDETIRQAIGSLNKLQSTPRIFLGLTRLLADSSANLRQISALVEQDPALSARVLQIVNSAFFGLPQPMANLVEAVIYLGVDAIRNIAFSVELFRSFDGRRGVFGFSIDSLQRHSYLTAKIATRLVADRRLAKDVFTAALLHDVGKVVLASQIPKRFAQAIQLSSEERRPLDEVELELNGFTHAEAGAYLLGLWGLPYPIVEAVAHHHRPSRVPHRDFDAVSAVHVANYLAHEQTLPADEKAGPAFGKLDRPYLEALGVQQELPRWRVIATEQTGSGPAQEVSQ